MTGEKNRYKTHEQLWKLEDGELSTPQHDELVLHFLNKNNIKSLLGFLDVGYYNTLFSYPTAEQIKKELMNTARQKIGNEESIKPEMMDNLRSRVEVLADGYIETNLKYINDTLQYEERSTVVNKIESEVPIKSSTNFIIGYVDVQIVIKSCFKSAIQSVDSPYELEFVKTVHEVPFEERMCTNYNPTHDENVHYRGIISGIIQIYNYLPEFTKYDGNLAWKNPDEDFKKINIEVKPKIKSFGETLRQINTYREFYPHALYIIYSPDTRFKEAFETQGVKLITPSDLGINM